MSELRRQSVTILWISFVRIICITAAFSDGRTRDLYYYSYDHFHPICILVLGSGISWHGVMPRVFWKRNLDLLNDGMDGSRTACETDWLQKMGIGGTGSMC
jgi:hypothetical protein